MTLDSEKSDGAQRRSTPAAAHRVALMVVLSLAASILLYVVIGVAASGRARPGFDASMLRKQFYAVALFLALGSIILRRTQLGRTRLQAVAMARGADGVVRHLVSTTIICAMLGESIAILGLALTILGDDLSDVLRLGLVGLVVILLNYPRRAAWQRAVDYFASTKSGF